MSSNIYEFIFFYVNNFDFIIFFLSAICVIALDQRIGCLDSALPSNSEPQQMINSVHEMFELFYKLEVSPSLWRLYDTRTLKKLFKTLDTINQ